MKMSPSKSIFSDPLNNYLNAAAADKPILNARVVQLLIKTTNSKMYFFTICLKSVSRTCTLFGHFLNARPLSKCRFQNVPERGKQN